VRAESGASFAGEAVTGPTPSRTPWAILQHVEYEGPGLVAEALRSAGQPFDVVRLDLHEALPEVTSIGGLVVLGGPMGVHDGDVHAWLAPERDLLAAVADAGKPVLGVCLGAQQLAAALGASVTTGPTAEVGLGRVELTGPGRLDPVMGPEYGGLSATTIPCVHWHQDTFDLPDGAIHLAATRPVPHQAFRWGDHAYGLQFHVEVDRQLADGWKPYLPSGATLDRDGLAEVTTVGRRLLGRFVERSSGTRPGARRPVTDGGASR
jgi:GMP synthase-like glutamine amidotransferase